MRRLLFLFCLCAAAGLGVVSAVRATTLHTLTVDGDLADFAGDEQTAGDPLGDSSYPGGNNDLSSLAISWDAQKLYLGFGYQAENSGVLYLIETGRAGGATQMCRTTYTGAFPANLQVQGAAVDLMVAFFAPADHAKPSVPYVYAFSSNGLATTDITTKTGVQVALKEVVASLGRTGAVEAGIPWDEIYGLGAGKVPAGATLKIAGVLRGKLDNDGLGDASPNPTGGVKQDACGKAPTILDTFHTVSVDPDGDGLPDPGWSPGANTQKTDGGPAPDSQPTPDLPVTVDQSPPLPDQLPPAVDQAVVKADRPVSQEDALVSSGDRTIPADDLGGTDAKVTRKDAGIKKDSQDEGCACQASGQPGASLALSLVLGLGLMLGRRRRR